MKKITLLLPVFAVSLLATTDPSDTLTGDKRTACEVILCMSSGTKPSECDSPIKKFFSIKAKKPWKTLQLRRDFLKLCPNSDNAVEDDAIMADLKEAIINAPHECTANFLNTKLEYIQGQAYYPENNCTFNMNDKLVRITQKLPQECVKLINNAYTDLKMPKNICSNKYYKIKDFNRGYYETVVNESGSFRSINMLDKLSKPSSLWQNLYNQNKSQVSKYRCNYIIKSDEHFDKTYYYDVYMQKHKINKECWVY